MWLCWVRIPSRDLTDVTLVSEDAFYRLDWCEKTMMWWKLFIQSWKLSCDESYNIQRSDDLWRFVCGDVFDFLEQSRLELFVCLFVCLRYHPARHPVLCLWYHPGTQLYVCGITKEPRWIFVVSPRWSTDLFGMVIEAEGSIGRVLLRERVDHNIDFIWFMQLERPQCVQRVTYA